MTAPQIAVTLVAGISLSAACGRAARPENLLVITLDTVRADRLPAYGFAGVATPAIDRIAAEGAVFEQAFAPVPLTLPSHTSLFTGLLPFRHGVRDNASPSLRAEFATLATILRAQGFATAAFVASAVLSSDRGLASGFDTYRDPPPGCGGMARLRRPAEEVVQDAIAWVSHRPAAPFFLWVHLFDTHRPFELPAEVDRLYADPYLAALAYEDAQISRLIDHLARRRALQNTLIVIAGDHGESQGDHGEEAHGLLVYQKVLHVPLIVRGPTIAPRRVRAVARLIDVFPTVLDLLGLDGPRGDGVSLARLLDGTGSDRREVYAESMYPRRFGWAGLQSLRADRYKVILAPRPELYDLDADPDEQRNLFAERPMVANAMLKRLRELETEQAWRPGESEPVDAALTERLAALGYAASGAADPPAPAAGAIDPKDRVESFNRMTVRQWQQGAERQARHRGCRPEPSPLRQ